MSKIFSIAKKELSSYFRSPIATIIFVLTISIFNIFFFMIIDENQEASLRDVFKVMEFMFVFFVPLLTMKIFAEEKSAGTMEFLMTTPTSNGVIVLGKYLGCLIFFSTIIVLTTPYYFIIEFFGSPDRTAVLVGYLGIWLEGALFLAMGMLASSWTRNQVVAAIISYGVLFLLYFSTSFIHYVDGVTEAVVRYVSLLSHSENFSVGLLTSADVSYYIGGIMFCLFVTQLSICVEKRPHHFIRILFAVILLIEVGYLTQKYSVRWDLTKTKQHTLNERTLHFIKDLKQDVQLTAFYSGLPPKYLEDLLKEYERSSKGRIATEIIDPVRQIGYAAQFGRVINSGENKVIVQSGKERRDIDFTKESLSEEQLTNALVRVTRKKRTVYFLTGHGEYSLQDKGNTGLTTFRKLLEENNIVTKTLMLGIREGIPEDCDALVIAGAQEELTEKETVSIKEYLRKGGDALFLIEHVLVTTPDKPLTEKEKMKNPSLNSILGDWGVRVASDVVVDLESHAGGDVGSPATRNYMAHKAIVKNLDYTFYVRPRSISVSRIRRPTIKVAPIVLTASSEQSWGETDRTLRIKFNAGVDRAGPVPIAVVIWEARAKNKPSDTRLIVFTDADFISNAYISQYSNATMGLNVMKWISELDYEVFLNKKDIKVERLNLTSHQKRTIALLLILMPSLIILSGIGINWKR